MKGRELWALLRKFCKLSNELVKLGHSDLHLVGAQRGCGVKTGRKGFPGCLRGKAWWWTVLGSSLTVAEWWTPGDSWGMGSRWKMEVRIISTWCDGCFERGLLGLNTLCSFLL